MNRSALTLEPFHRAVNAGKLSRKSRFDKRRLTFAMCDPPDMRAAIVGHTQLLGDSAIQTLGQTISINLDGHQLPLESHNVASQLHKNDSPVNICQGENVPVASYSNNENLATRIRAARESVLKLSQAAFGTRLGVSQSNVSKWEKNALKPETEHLIKLANLLQGRIEGLYFLQAAGIPLEFLMSNDPVTHDDGAVSRPGEKWASLDGGDRSDHIRVPLLRDAAAAGTPRSIDEREFETTFYLPKAWMPLGAKPFAVRASGDSMSPNICDGDIVVADLAQHDAKRLNGRIVLARNSDGVTIKWLHRSGALSFLVPQDPGRQPVTVMDPADDWQILGVVVHWMGFPLKRK